MAIERDVAMLSQRLDSFLRSELASLYDEKRDVLFIFRIGERERRPAIGVDVNGDFWIMQEPGTGQIENIEIEDLESVFLVKYPQLRTGWAEARAIQGQGSDSNRAFISQIVAVLGDIHSAAA